MKRTVPAATALAIALLALMVVGICIGSVEIPLSAIVEAIVGIGKDGISNAAGSVYIARNIRLPRVLCAVFAGGVLAMGGVVFQCVFRNPMADSYILGVSSGASCFIGLNMLLSVGLGNTPAALIGSTATTALLFAMSSGDHNRLLLNGIAVNFLLSSVTTLCIYLGKRQLDSVLYWTMGSLNGSTWTKAIVLLAMAAVAFAVLMSKASALDMLLLDDSTAISSGLDVKPTRIVLLAVASALTAVVVSFCGIIGFVGLMAPHLARQIVGTKHRRLIPFSVLIGSLVLLCSDILARTVVAPSEIPIGIITSILGSPIFIVLLRRRGNGL